MKRVPFRWFLPSFHFVMDSILVLLILQHEEALRRQQRGWAAESRTRIAPVAFQETGALQFDPKYIDGPPSPPLYLLGTSTLPAFVASAWAIPNAWLDRIDWRSTERWWLTLLALTTALFWFVAGSIADRGHLSVYRWCFALVMIRIVALSVVASPIWRLGLILQGLFWLGVAISVLAEGLWLTMRNARRAF
jgi:hypothetical protein